jgi:hypothetical protein
MAQTTTLVLPVINDNTQLMTFLDKAKETMIPLVPEMYNFVKPELKIGFQKITVDIEKDAYKTDGGNYALNLKKLNEIAQASGLNVTASKQVTRDTDKDGRVVFVKHEVKWEMRSIDGSLKIGTATGEYNYKEDVARLLYKEDTYEKVWDGGQKKMVNTKTLLGKKGDPNYSQINKRRTYAGSLAESNAISRAINKGIAKLQNNFKAEELKKPFLVPCVIEDPSDLLKKYPELERAYLAKMVGVADVIYPHYKTGEIIPEEKQPEKKNYEEAQIITPEKEKQPELSPEEVIRNEAETFREAPQKERTEIIERLIKEKQYKRANPNTPIEKFSIDKQIELIIRLRELPVPVIEGEI